MNTQPNKRDVSIDILRGFAVFTMVLANLGPVLKPPHPFVFRLYGSFAAPIFITITGMMVSLTSTKQKHLFKYYLLRGTLILICGALVDPIAWGVVPFMTMDVLYLIGLSLPGAYLANKLSLKWLISLVSAIFLLTPVLQKFLGYIPHPTELYLDGSSVVELKINMSIFHHWVIDGWFPLFPWLGFAFLGCVLAKLRWDAKGHTLDHSSLQNICGFLFIVVGSLLWWLAPGPSYEREGFSELFYPPSTGYILFAIGAVLLLLYFFSSTRSWKGWNFFRVLGEASLFMYIFHSVVIGRLVLEQWENLNMMKTLGIYAILIITMSLSGIILQKIKLKTVLKPFCLRFILGG